MKKYTVQAFAHVKRAMCEHVKNDIERNTYFNPTIVQRGLDYAVVVGEYETKERAEKVLSELSDIGVKGIIR